MLWFSAGFQLQLEASVIESMKNTGTACEWQSTYNPLPNCVKSEYARDRWIETEAFMQKRKKQDRAALDTAKRQNRINADVSQLEKKKKVLQDVMGLSPEKLREEIYQAKKRRWKDLFEAMGGTTTAQTRVDTAYQVVGCACLMMGVQFVAIPTALPIALICYSMTDNVLERRLKKVLLFPDEVKAEHEKLCLRIDKARQGY